MMPLRVAIPNSVMKPTSDAMLIVVAGELRDLGLLLDGEVDDARHVAHGHLGPLCERAELVEIFAVELDHEACAHAAHQVLDAVADRLAHGYGEAGDFAGHLAHVGEDPFPVALAEIEAH